jgi:NAD+ synthase (glutamine-hydrolysing)
MASAASSSASLQKPPIPQPSSPSAWLCRSRGQLFNAAALVHRGQILGLVPKEKLPTYNVFYEGRTFSRGGPGLALEAKGVPVGDYVFKFDFGTVAVEVCEDAWSPDGPMRRRCYSGAEIVVNVSCSPYRMGVDATRREMLATRAADNESVLIYANAVGGQDGLIYDGGSLIFQNGRLMLARTAFRDGWWAAVVDLDRTRRLRLENTTWRTDCETFRLQRATVPTITCSGATSSRASLTYPAPDGGNFFLRRARASTWTRAMSRSTTCSKRSPSASRAITKKPGRSARSASHSRVVATRC